MSKIKLSNPHFFDSFKELLKAQKMLKLAEVPMHDAKAMVQFLQDEERLKKAIFILNNPALL